MTKRLACVIFAHSKAVGPDGIPVEVWRCLGEEGMDILWDLFTKIYQQKKIPECGETACYYRFIRKKETYKIVVTIGG